MNHVDSALLPRDTDTGSKSDGDRSSGRERGQTTVLVALMLGTFLFGFMALGTDVAYFFQQKRMAQVAADAAAVAAAEELSGSSPSLTNAQNAAYAMAKANGFDTGAAKNAATVTCCNQPTTGNYNAAGYIEVDVSKPVPTIFLAAFDHKATITVSARAVAGGNQTAPTCVCLEGTSGNILNMSNNAHLTTSGCGIVLNSNTNGTSWCNGAACIVGSASVTAPTLSSIATNWDNSNDVNNAGTIGSGTNVVQGISTPCSPPLPTVPTYNSSQCTADPLSHYGNGGSSYYVGPSSTYSTTQTGGVVCYNSLTVGANGDSVTLNPGIYVISGGQLHFEYGANNASNQGGNGVFFYLTNGASLSIDNGANVNITAPSSGTYNGVLVFQDPSDTNAISAQGGSSTNFNGAIYAPSAPVTLGNGSSSGFNADIIAKSLTMNGGAKLTSTAGAGLGTLSTSVAKLTE